MAGINTPPLQQQQPQFLNTALRQATQQFGVGIAAGAEDVKYQAKYKDLKRKVKEIESDNDKLHYKVLQAKRSIQRMKLERAVLYERLQQVPQTSEDRLALSLRSPGMAHQSQQHHPLPPNHTSPDYVRTHPGTLRPGPMDSPMPLPHNSRRGSLGGPDPTRPVQFMHSLGPPPQQDPHRAPPSHTHAPMHTSPHMHASSHRDERGRSPPRGRAHAPPQVYQPPQPPYPDIQHSPPPRRQGPDINELAARQHPLSPTSDARASRGVHNHQRMGPGTYINRDESERDWDRGRPRDAQMHSPPLVHRSRPVTDYPDTRRRDEPGPAYYGDRRVFSRSNSPGSGSRSGSAPNDGGPSRPDSRTQFYDGEPQRRASFRLRPVAKTEDPELGHDDRDAPPPQGRDRGHNGNGGGGYSAGPEPVQRESRKRSRTEMDDDGHGPPGLYSRHEPEPRNSKRYHQASERM